MKYIFENFKNIYEFEKTLKARPVKEIFQKEIASADTKDFDFYQTKDFDEAETLLKDGWNPQIDYIKKELNKFAVGVNRSYNKQIKSIAGFAPCVPNAIRGVPKSMISTKKVEKKQRTVHLVINNCTRGSTSGEALMKSGLLFMKLAMLLEKNNIRTKIDVVPKMSKTDTGIFGCSVTIKDYKQPFNISKIAYPLAHVSFFRRHGFRWWETIDAPMNENALGYGKSIMFLDKSEKQKYLKYASLTDNILYVDYQDALDAGNDLEKLIKNKQIKIK